MIFIDSMAVDEKDRGMGIGHLFFEEVKRITVIAVDKNNINGKGGNLLWLIYIISRMTLILHLL